MWKAFIVEGKICSIVYSTHSCFRLVHDGFLHLGP